MSATATLDRIDMYRQLLEDALLDDGVILEPVDLGGVDLGSEDRDRAETILAELEHLLAHVEGMKTRIAGELAGLRRPNREAHRRMPRTLDTTL